MGYGEVGGVQAGDASPTSIPIMKGSKTQLQELVLCYKNFQMCLNEVYLCGKNTLHAWHCKDTSGFELMVEILDAAVGIPFCSENKRGSLQFYSTSASFFPY